METCLRFSLQQTKGNISVNTIIALFCGAHILGRLCSDITVLKQLDIPHKKASATTFQNLSVFWMRVSNSPLGSVPAYPNTLDGDLGYILCWSCMPGRLKTSNYSRGLKKVGIIRERLIGMAMAMSTSFWIFLVAVNAPGKTHPRHFNCLQLTNAFCWSQCIADNGPVSKVGTMYAIFFYTH